MTNTYIYVPLTSSSSSGGISSGGTVATGSSITFAGNGPASTSGDINFTATGIYVAARNFNNTADTSVIKNNGAGGILQFGDNSVAAFTDTFFYGYDAALLGFAANNEIYLSANGDMTIDSFTGKILLQKSATTKAYIDAGGLTIPTGSNINLLSNGGPIATSGLINTTATGIIMSARNYNNTTDANIIKLDGAADLYFGDATPGIQDTVVVGDTVAIYSRGQAGQITFDAVGNVSLSTTATVSLANPAATVSIQNQRYGAQRVTSDFPSSATGIATAPSQLLFNIVGGQNIAFDANLTIIDTGTGGMRAAVSVPSGVNMLANFSGATGLDSFSITSSSLSATAVGTGVYANTINAPSQVSIQGTIWSSAGATGVAMATVMPWTSGHTGVIKTGSAVFTYPST